MAQLSKPNTIPWRRLSQTWTRYALMVLMALAFFALILLIFGINPLSAYGDILTSTLGSSRGFSEVIVAMIPILITALAVAVPWRVGLINVGGEGQLYIGAAFATFGALTFSSLPSYILLPLMAILGMVGGALWAFVPGYLKAIGLVNETITSLLLNSIAPKIVGFLIFGFWHSQMDTVKTENFVPAAILPRFFGTRIHLGLIIGLLLLLVFWYLMKYSRWGLEMRAIGGNANAAARNGLPVKRYLITNMCVGGAIAGLAGMVQISGFYGVLFLNFSVGLGFMGFLICWLAGGKPLGILVMSFIVAIILTGGNLLQITRDLPFAVVNILLGFTLFVVLAKPRFFGKERA